LTLVHVLFFHDAKIGGRHAGHPFMGPVDLQRYALMTLYVLISLPLSSGISKPLPWQGFFV
ncbi:MAG: hypothetical protein ACK4GK_01570, partial [Ferrovibrio sp.]